MSGTHDPKARARTVRPVAVAGAVAGILLFAYSLRAAGLGDVAAGVRKVGLGFLFVLLLAGLRQLVRAAAWALCIEPAEHLRVRDTFVAFVTGDAIGNLTPFGPVASEGTKAVLVRRHLPPLGALSSIALENLFYGLSVAVMVAIGALAFLYGFQLSPDVRDASFVMAATAASAIAFVWWLLYRRPRWLSGLAAWVTGHGPGSAPAGEFDSVRTLEDRIHGFAARYPRRVARILLLEFTFHAAGVAEAYLLLSLLAGSSPHTFLQAVVLETVNRIITVIFKFVPLRVGVDEAGSGLLTGMLGLGSATGVTMAIIRKARTLIWAAVGVAFLAGRGLSVGTLVKEASRK